MGCRGFALTTPRNPLREGFFTLYNIAIRRVSGEYQEHEFERKVVIDSKKILLYNHIEGIALSFTNGSPSSIVLCGFAILRTQKLGEHGEAGNLLAGLITGDSG
jgi:hypothetical protein